jgi:hypothetical protein
MLLFENTTSSALSKTAAFSKSVNSFESMIRLLLSIVESP